MQQLTNTTSDAKNRIPCARIRAKSETETLYRLHYQELFNYTVKCVGNNKDIGLEITQDIFVLLYSHILKGGKIQHERGFLYKIARTKIIDFYRKEKTQLTAQLKTETPNETESYNQEKQIINQETLKQLEKAICELAPIQRAVFVLKTYDDRKIKEISKICNISISTTERYLAFSYKYLRNKITT